ncbi:MAG: DUF1688 family protein [Burkholderiales bacterium]
MPPTVVTVDSDHARAIALLRSASEVRARSHALLARARAHQSRWFRINDGAMDNTAELVSEVTQVRFPDLNVPPHSCWRQLGAGAIDRAALLDQRLADVSADERARAQIDLAFVCVLLDAGAGPDWSFRERDRTHATEHAFLRSDGLVIATFHAFKNGLFSSDPARPLRVDSAALALITAERLGAAFQAREGNRLAGLEARVALLHRLSRALTARTDVFSGAGANEGSARPGNLYDFVGAGLPVTAPMLLDVLLDALAPLSPTGNLLAGIPLGDCWRHDAVRGAGASDGFMPLHSQMQWLVLSLIEPFEWAGVKVAEAGALTGPAEHRNGGLFLDAGVLRPIKPRFAEQAWRVGDEFIVEWRALTVALLDELAPLVRERLGLPEARFELPRLLEGGTRAAGRVLAKRLRAGLPPVRIVNDGTAL